MERNNAIDEVIELLTKRRDAHQRHKHEATDESLKNLHYAMMMELNHSINDIRKLKS